MILEISDDSMVYGILPLALLAFSLASPSFAAEKPDEIVTTTGSRIRTPGNPSPSGFPGGAGPGRPQFEKPRFEGAEGGGDIDRETPPKAIANDWARYEEIQEA